MTSLPAKRPLSRDDIYRKATAYHESGHAVMAVCLGGTIIKPGVRIDAAWHCQARFRYGPLDGLEREYTQVIFGLAGWRAEHLWHHRGSEKREEAELRDCISEASFLEGENGTDDAGAFVDMLLRTPDATDDKLLVRYRQYCDHCYALLRNPLIWSAVESLATSLIEQGDHDAEAALAAMGDDCEALSDAAAIMRIEAIANDQLPIFDDADLLRQLQQLGLQIETLPSG